MKFQFFFPEILNFPTGGNIFNHHLMREFSRNYEVKTTVISSTNAADKEEREDFEEDAYCMVDSLLIRNTTFMKRFGNIKKTKSKWLIAHYLNILDPQNSSASDRKKERDSLKIFDGFIVTSHYSKRMLIDSGIDAHRIVIIQPGIFMRYPSKRKQRLIVQILTVSSIFPGKGLPEFLPLLESLSDLPWQWILVGEDRLHPEFTREFMGTLEDFRLKNRIQFLGPISQMSLMEIFKQSDIFVLNSRFESCSMVTMEALAFGLPVVVNQVGGLPELVDHKKNGYLVPLADTQLFSDSIRKLISDPELRLSMGKEGYQRSRSFPSWQESTEEFLRFIPAESIISQLAGKYRGIFEVYK
jgi:glycosyltransferase involved in cell wall biosynthesis